MRAGEGGGGGTTLLFTGGGRGGFEFSRRVCISIRT